MFNHEQQETVFLTKEHALLVLGYDHYPRDAGTTKELDIIINNFCGSVFRDVDGFNNRVRSLGKSIQVYFIGDVNKLEQVEKTNVKNIKIIKEFCIGHDLIERIKDQKSIDVVKIGMGQVPINVHDVGLLFKKFFDNPNKDYYYNIMREHRFQRLTESDKPGTAFRTGIYLSKVEKENESDGFRFKLLRCSTNFDGPTDNFRQTDVEIIEKVNETAKEFFNDPADLNHVLAQAYHNCKVFNEKTNTYKEKKATIKAHSDKTKDMPRNGLIVFCTFYENYYNNKFNHVNHSELKHLRNPPDDFYDYRYKQKTTALTKLRFRLKTDATHMANLVKSFEVTLYPNSVFVIPLSTNRLFTHEIVPSNLPINFTPTRMGYVIRCSTTDALFIDDETYIEKQQKQQKSMVKMVKPTPLRIKELKEKYVKENKGIEPVEYGFFDFSLNQSDYRKPIF